MAHKPESFKADPKKKVITIYTNIDNVPAEQMLIGVYISQGYAVKMEEKKATKTVEDMRKELELDKEVLKAFNDAYEEKADGKKEFKETGFAKACKIYTDWKKEHG